MHITNIKKIIIRADQRWIKGIWDAMMSLQYDLQSPCCQLAVNTQLVLEYDWKWFLDYSAEPPCIVVVRARNLVAGTYLNLTRKHLFLSSCLAIMPSIIRGGQGLSCDLEFFVALQKLYLYMPKIKQAQNGDTNVETITHFVNFMNLSPITNRSHYRNDYGL